MVESRLTMGEPFKRKLLTLKSPRKKKAIASIHGMSKPAQKPKQQKKQPKKKKIPKIAPPPMPPIPSGSANPVWPYLKTSPAFLEHKPMAIGFLEQALEGLPEGLTYRQLRKCLKYRARSSEYLELISRGGDRYNFDGSLADPIDPGGQEKAAHRLKQLKKRIDTLSGQNTTEISVAT